MPRLNYRQSDKPNMTSYSGLALIEQCGQAAQVKAVNESRLLVLQGMRTPYGVKTIVVPLIHGKSDFNPLPFRDGSFFKESLSISKAPSSVTKLQRFDASGARLRNLTAEPGRPLLERTKAQITAPQSYVGCGIDTFACWADWDLQGKLHRTPILTSADVSTQYCRK